MRFGFTASHGTVHEALQLAQAVEEHDWDGFFTWDGLSIGSLDTWDPWVLLGAAALRTRRVRLGAMVFALARRRPWKVARETITVDHLSDGRLVLPVGLGAIEDGGFANVRGEPRTARERADRLDEALAVLELAWTGERFSYEGSHASVTDLLIAPTPVQRPRVPVWTVAGHGAPRSLGRAARWDGAILQRVRGFEPLTPAEVAESVAWLRERRAAVARDEPGRHLGDFDVVVEGVLPADPAQAREHVLALEEAGATWWVESRWEGPGSTPDALLARVRKGPPVG